MLAGALATGCGASLRRFPFDAEGALGGALGITLDHYGVCCARVAWAGGSVLFDPFFTRLPLRTVAFGRAVPDPAALGDRAAHFADTRAVLVGHSHYDHAMGIPLVDPLLPPDAVHMGSPTLAHTFAASALAHPIVPLSGDQVAHATHPGRWVHHPSGALRVLPIASGHPAQYLFFHLYRRSLDRDRRRPPTRAHHYQEGATLAFLVDLMDGDRVQARVYVQSSSTGPPAGFFPASILRDRPVDLAIVSMDVANRERAHGDSVLHLLGAPTVVFTHYEDFFRPEDQPPREIVKVDLPATRAHFAARADARYLFPAAGARFEL